MESKFKKYTLLHNPRCRKSREGLEYLKSKEIEFETILYLKNRLNKKEIESLINRSGLNPMDLIRKQEKVWKELYKSKKLSKSQKQTEFFVSRVNGTHCSMGIIMMCHFSRPLKSKETT